MISLPRQATLPVLLVLLVACAKPVVKSVPTETTASAPPAAVAKPEPRRLPVLSIEQIVRLLESGKYASAKIQLRRLLAENPDNDAAKNLLEQVTSDPITYLGPEHQPYVVKPGDTLSSIARSHLGSAMRFVILARYNALALPSRLEVGQTLKIPSNLPANRQRALPGTPSSSATASGWPPPIGTDATTLARLYRERIENLIAAERYPEAVDTAAEAGKRQPSGNAWEPWLGPLDRRANALLWQQRGIEQMGEPGLQSHETAYDDFGKALALAPGLEPATERRNALRNALVLDYHEAAIIRYRNQQLDEALAFWDKALALDPQFAPAQGYRLRALELKRRVRNLDAEASQQPATGDQ